MLPFYWEQMVKLGCTMVRATKLPPGAGSLSHDVTAGALPHNFFSIGYTGKTYENRAAPGALAAVEQVTSLTRAFAAWRACLDAHLSAF